MTPHREPKVEKEKPKTTINPFALLNIEDDEDEDGEEDEDSGIDSGEDFEEISNIKLCEQRCRHKFNKQKIDL